MRDETFKTVTLTVAAEVRGGIVAARDCTPDWAGRCAESTSANRGYPEEAAKRDGVEAGKIWVVSVQYVRSANQCRLDPQN